MPILLLSALLMLQTAAQEPPAPPAPDVEAVAPQAREGAVELECSVQRNGRVSNCLVLSETPPGLGLAEAALNAARRARMSPRSVNGVATGGKVRFTTRFRLED